MSTEFKAKRQILGQFLTPFLRLTGFRFSKEYRHGTTRWHRFVYRHVDTVGANIRAGL